MTWSVTCFPKSDQWGNTTFFFAEYFFIILILFSINISLISVNIDDHLFNTASNIANHRKFQISSINEHAKSFESRIWKMFRQLQTEIGVKS